FQGQDPVPIGTLGEPRLSVTYRATDQLQLRGYIGWFQGGLEMRVMPWASSKTAMPLAVTVGGQGAQLARSTTWDARVMLSIHPSVNGVPVMLGAGLSAGRMAHQIYLPDGPLAT